MKGDTQPEWLRESTSGIVGGESWYILLEGKRFAIVVSPGVMWYDRSGSHYGAISYYLVDKQAPRNSWGIMRYSKEVKNGGRVTKALRAKWEKMVKASDDVGEYVLL